MGVACIYRASQVQIVRLLENAPQLHVHNVWHSRVLAIASAIFLVAGLKRCAASITHAIPIEPNTVHSHQWA